MKKRIKRIIHSVLFWHIVGAILVLAVIVKLWFLGFKITYNPELDNNWEAIGATANWASVIVGAVIIPIVVAFLQHKWDNNKQEIANSNLAILEEVKRKQEEFESILQALKESTLVLDGGNAFNPTCSTTKDRIRQYISVAMTPTAREISTYMKIPLEELLPILKEMKEQRIIWTKYIRDDISAPDCRWKLLKK